MRVPPPTYHLLLTTMTEITYEAKLTPQQEANQAHYELAKAVRELLPKFCKDPSKFAPLLESEATIKELAQ